MSMRGSYHYQNVFFYDTVVSGGLGTSPWEFFPNLALEDPKVGYTLYDDFFTNTTGSTSTWQVVKGTGGSLALAAGLGGLISIPTAASANDYQTLATQQAVFKLTANKPICFEIGLSCTEANTNKASWFAGLTSTTSSGFISNAGAPPSSYSGAMFYKATGAMTLAFQTSNGSTQNTIANLGTVVSGTSYCLGAYISPNDGTTGQVTPYVSSLGTGAPTSFAIGATQNLTLSALAAQYFMFGVKAGSSSAETLSVDFVRIRAVR